MTSDIAREVEKIAEDLGIDRKRSIGEVAQELKIKTHVIRFWEENFSQIKPEIGAGGRRYYYNKQLKVLRRIKKFLYEDGYTIAGLQKLLNRKKHQDHSEEDLGIILASDVENHEMEPSHNEEVLHEVLHQAQIEIDDFIDPKVKFFEEEKRSSKVDVNVNPTARLLEFANITIPAIDPKIRNKIEKRLDSACDGLRKLKLLSEKF